MISDNIQLQNNLVKTTAATIKLNLLHFPAGVVVLRLIRSKVTPEKETKANFFPIQIIVKTTAEIKPFYTSTLIFSKNAIYLR